MLCYVSVSISSNVPPNVLIIPREVLKVKFCRMSSPGLTGESIIKLDSRFRGNDKISAEHCSYTKVDRLCGYK